MAPPMQPADEGLFQAQGDTVDGGLGDAEDTGQASGEGNALHVLLLGLKDTTPKQAAAWAITAQVWKAWKESQPYLGKVGEVHRE